MEEGEKERNLRLDNMIEAMIEIYLMVSSSLTFCSVFQSSQERERESFRSESKGRKMTNLHLHKN
jgi:hypothetical protein